MVIGTGWLVEIRKTEKYGGGLDDFYLALWIEQRMWGFVRFWCAGQNFLTCAVTCRFKLPILTHGKLYRRALLRLKQGKEDEKGQNWRFEMGSIH